MKIIRDIDELNNMPMTAVCIGKFDGVHLGHRKLIDKVVSMKSKGYKACVFTFDPSPEELFTGIKPATICSFEEKNKILATLGIDICVVFPLTLKSAAIPAEDFVTKILLEKLNMKYLVAGEDLSFGAGGKGNRVLIERMAKEYNFTVEIIEKVCYEGEQISSSRIRKAMEDSDYELAVNMLGKKKEKL